MKKGLILASFGTTHIDTREKAIENIEKAIANRFPDVKCLRCFTSRIVVKRIKENEGISIFNEKEAIDALLEDGIQEEDIYIQPLHMIPGVEYEKLAALKVGHLGKPLLYDEESIRKALSKLNFPDKEEANLVLFGHGSYHKSDDFYQKAQEILDSTGHDNVYVVTVEGSVTIEDVMDKLLASKKKVILKPFMIVAGDHAKNDMASDDPDSLKSILEGAGLETEVEMKGLGEEPGIVEEFIERVEGLLETEI
ncbi:MAG: sirohydrochlorin cobaltochelatase [Peptoniphilus sp. oral taxon 375]|nr:cobalt chelatase CbiK [Peptoniphilus sp. oral taxon 375 str. F0436]MBS4871417.1 sirohydrochlorin cobaltochelatase [Peptoniphilus sp. oral taxon 375]